MATGSAAGHDDLSLRLVEAMNAFRPPAPSVACTSPPETYDLPPVDRISPRWAAFRLGMLPERVRLALRAEQYSEFYHDTAVAGRDLSYALWDLRVARDLLAADMPGSVHASLGEALYDLEGEVGAFHARNDLPGPSGVSLPGAARYGPAVADRLAVLARQAVGCGNPLDNQAHHPTRAGPSTCRLPPVAGSRTPSGPECHPSVDVREAGDDELRREGELRLVRGGLAKAPAAESVTPFAAS